MTKSTPYVSTCFVFKSSPEACISPLVFPDLLPHIIWLALGFLPSYAPVICRVRYLSDELRFALLLILVLRCIHLLHKFH